MNFAFAMRLRERMPLIMQAEMAECGLACLAMVLGHYGFVTDLKAMRDRFQMSLRGMTLFDIKKWLKITT